ncbi:MAG: hypothetical protein LBR15_02965 [Methanobrevibacter sp.]|jgi:hypothetical protein|nr:hypothetical protein [Candidatus Methanovirga australis]
MTSTVSAYSHDDIRSGTLGYLSNSGWNQCIHITNTPNDPVKSYLLDYKTRNDAREYFCITKDNREWKAKYNSNHQTKFYIGLNLGSKTCYSDTITDIDWNKGAFVAADSYARGQWADLYYYSSNDGSKKSIQLNYYDP